ncbi:hypothetical protein L209DRAFT_760019 [Thermothelomyces heterothallicus CBS 203.75]
MWHSYLFPLVSLSPLVHKPLIHKAASRKMGTAHFLPLPRVCPLELHSLPLCVDLPHLTFISPQLFGFGTPVSCSSIRKDNKYIYLLNSAILPVIHTQPSSSSTAAHARFPVKD